MLDKPRLRVCQQNHCDNKVGFFSRFILQTNELIQKSLGSHRDNPRNLSSLFNGPER